MKICSDCGGLERITQKIYVGTIILDDNYREWLLSDLFSINALRGG